MNVLSHIFIQIIGEYLSVEHNISAIGDINQVLSWSEAVPEMGDSQVDWFVIGVAVLSIAISEADEGVNFESGRLVLPSGDGEKSANDVAVDRQELICIPTFHCRNIQQAGLSQIVPIFLTEGVIHEFIDIIAVPLTLRRKIVPGERGKEGVGRVCVVVHRGLGVGKGKGQQGEEDDGLRSH